MADQFAGLTLGVDVEQLNKAVKSLKDFKQANDSASKSVENFVDTEQVAKQQAKELAAQLAKQNKEFRNIQSAIDPTADKMDKLRKAASQLDALWKKGIVPDDTFFELGSILETQQNKLALTKKALTEEGRAALEESKQKAKAVAEGKKFIAALQEQAAAAGKTRAELVEMKAAQLGVAEQAAPFVAQLRAQEKQMKLAGITAGQYSQAMRMLPMQITDVVTSLASGMPVWMVAIQQGGQIKDSFGGIGNTFKVLLSYLNPLNVSLGLAAAGFGALVFSVMKARNEIKEANEAVKEGIGLTGDYADRLALNIRNIAKESGQTAKEVAETFINTNDGASEAIDKLINVGFSYDEARRKVEQYKGSSDFRVLNSDIEQHRLSVLGIKDAWSDAAEEVKNYYTGANQGKQSVALGGAVDPIVKILEGAKSLQSDINTLRIEGNKKVKETVDLIRAEYLASDRVAGAEAKLAEARKNAKAIQASGDTEAIKQAQKLIEIRKEELKEAQKAQEKRSKPKGGGATKSITEQFDRELYVLQAQLKTLQEHRTVNDVISQQRKALWSIEKQIEVLEEAQSKRKLNAGEKNLLNEQKAVLEMAKQKAELGDQIMLQERKNKLEQNSIQFIKDQAAAIAEIQAKAEGKGNRFAEMQAEIAKLRAQWEQQGGNLDDVLLTNMEDAIKQRYEQEAELRSNWLAGAKNAWAEYEDDAKNVYSSVGNIATSALNGLTDQMTEFLTTGKASFQDFATSIIKMIVKMIMQMVIFNSLSGLGFGGGKAITLGGLMKGFASGGYTGDGGKYEPKGVVHGGEFVFTKEATKRIGVANLNRMMRGYANGGAVGSTSSGSTISGGAGTNFNFGGINVDINNGNDPKGMETGVRMIVTEMMKRACTQGGEIYEFVMAKRG